MTEVWKPVKDWEDYYEVSNLGNIRNIKTKKLIKGDINNCGYHRVRFEIGERRKRFFRHRLVAEHFIENNNINKTQVNHINGDKSNNCVWNLEWVTPSENDKHAFRIGLKHKTHNKPFKVIFINGEEKVFESLTELSNTINISYATVSLWLNDKLNTYNEYGIKELYYL